MTRAELDVIRVKIEKAIRDASVATSNLPVSDTAALLAEIDRLRSGIDSIWLGLRYDSYDQAREQAEANGEKYTGGVYEDLQELRKPWAGP